MISSIYKIFSSIIPPIFPLSIAEYILSTVENFWKLIPPLDFKNSWAFSKSSSKTPTVITLISDKLEYLELSFVTKT